jgi:hypothetical protein
VQLERAVDVAINRTAVGPCLLQAPTWEREQRTLRRGGEAPTDRLLTKTLSGFLYFKSNHITLSSN